VTLHASGGVITSGAPLNYVFEVATDDGFSKIVATKTVSPGATADAAVILDQLTGSTDYFWRVRTVAADHGELVSKTFKFTIGPLVTIAAPVPVETLDGAYQHKRPTLSVANAARTGPVSSVVYRFEIAANAAFSAVSISGDVPEGMSQTSFTPTADLASGAMFYWRVRAADSATSVTSSYSSTQRFTTVNPDDGSFPYVLSLHAPPNNNSSCQLRFGPDYDTRSYPTDLVVSGDTLRFTVFWTDYSTPTPFPGFNIHMTRTGNRLSGTLGGLFPISHSGVFHLYINGNNAGGDASLSGNASNDGRLTGTFGGQLEESDCCENHGCIAPNFAWTLTPGR
jgi:hypothetical protein